MASIGKGFMGAVAGGVLGAAAWGALTYFTGYEIGFVAWGIGALVGVGMYWMSKGVGGAGAGVLAALVAIAAVLGGKLTVAHFMARDFVGGQLAEGMTDEDAVLSLASDEAERIEAEGGDAWAPDEESYSAAVMNAAKGRWRAMSALDREHFKDELQAQAEQDASAATGIVTVIAFLTSFGLYDFIWLGLSVSTAYRIGSQPAAGIASAAGASTDGALVGAAEVAAVGAVEGPRAVQAPAGSKAAAVPKGPAAPAKEPRTEVSAFWGRGDAARMGAEAAGAPMCKPMIPVDEERKAA